MYSKIIAFKGKKLVTAKYSSLGDLTTSPILRLSGVGKLYWIIKHGQVRNSCNFDCSRPIGYERDSDMNVQLNRS
jgi:hypothetical protein